MSLAVTSRYMRVTWLRKPSSQVWLPTTLPHKADFGTTRQRVHRRGVAMVHKVQCQTCTPSVLVNIQSRKESISKLKYSMPHFRAFSSTSRVALRPGISVVTKVAKGFGYFYLTLTTIPIGLSCIAAYNYFVKRDDRHARGSLFYSWTGWLCLPLSLPVILAYPYVYFYDRYQRSFMDNIQKLWARTTTKYFFRTHVVGTKNISKLNGDPAVYISNHQSWLDAYALFWIDVAELKIVLKRELMLIPVVGWALKAIGHIPFNRSNKESGSNAIKHCSKLLENNTSVFLFPEGTRSKDGNLRKFKIGAFKIAVDNKAPIVPITIHGTGKMMPPGDELSLGTDDITVQIHEPIFPKPDETASELRTRVRSFYTKVLENFDENA